MIKKLTKIGLVMLSVIMTLSVFTACSENFDENKAIVVVSREENSGTRTAFMELIFGKELAADIELPTAYVKQTTYSAVFSKVKSDPQAIAYDSFGFATDDVKRLSFNGVACTDENITNGDYTLMRPFSLVYRKERVATDLNTKFLEFIMSSNAQTMISANNLTADSNRTTPYVVEEGLSGTVKLSGGSTVKLIVDKLAEEFMRLQPKVTVSVAGGGDSADGRNDVKNDLVDFGMVGATVTDSHIATMGGAEIIDYTQLCSDGITIIVNKKNPITNITTEQLKNIYNKNSGTTYSNWAELMAEQAQAETETEAEA